MVILRSSAHQIAGLDPRSQRCPIVAWSSGRTSCEFRKRCCEPGPADRPGNIGASACPHPSSRSSALTSPPACRATSAVPVLTATGMRCPAGSARTCASGHRHLLASPRRRLTDDHDEDIQQQQRNFIEEQARHDIWDRRAVAIDEFPPGAPGPQRVTDTERLAQWHRAAPADLRAGSER